MEFFTETAIISGVAIMTVGWVALGIPLGPAAPVAYQLPG